MGTTRKNVIHDVYYLDLKVIYMNNYDICKLVQTNNDIYKILLNSSMIYDDTTLTNNI